MALRIDVHNRLAGPFYLRLRGVHLVGVDAALAADAECSVSPGTTTGVVEGAVWVPATQMPAVRGVHVDAFAVPLSERGRAFYREFLLRQRPGDAAAIDAELAAYAAAPPCQVPPP